MHAIIIHGMGRTALSMRLLAFRIRSAGVKTRLFSYTATFERLVDCKRRLQTFIEKHVGNEDFIVVTHSLGSVLIRAVLPTLPHKPTNCFFLAPPTQACYAARRLATLRWYRLLTGEMGQLLANQDFMTSLAIPDMPTKIYAGNAGATGRFSPFGEASNDGILLVKETLLPGISVQIVPSLHTFIMNNQLISKDIIESIRTRKGY